MKNMMRNVAFALLAASGLFLLGCWPGRSSKKIEAGDVVLLKIDSKPVLTKSEFYKELAGMLQGMDPALLPKDKQERAFQDFMNFKLMVAAAKKSGLEKDKEYLEGLKEQTARLSDVLLSRMYEKKLFEETEVPADDVRAEYNKNKLRYVKEQGGVLVSGVSFKNLSAAKAFYEKAKSKKKEDFESAAKKEKDGKFMELGRVGKDAAGYSARFTPEVVREAALKLSKLPAVDLVKAGDETWVIYVSDKRDPVLFEFAEIEKRIEQQLKVNKFMGERTRRLKELEKKMDVEVNKAFFAAPAAPEEQKMAPQEKQGGASA